MAIYHCSVKTVSRAKGGSSVASASYRAAEKLKDLKNEKEFDYTRKQSVDFKQIIGWDGDRESLWNMAELSEKRKDATTAREYEVALPCELSNDQKIELAVNYGNWLNERHGVAVDVCIHQIDSQNPHAHILTTTRESLGSELGDKVAREWSDTRRKANGLDGRKNDLIEAKAKWADLINIALERNYIDERVSHLSLAEQGIDREPQIHVGYASNEMMKRGEVSHRVTYNQKIIENSKQEPSPSIKTDLIHKLHLDRTGKHEQQELRLCRVLNGDECSKQQNKITKGSERWKANILKHSDRCGFGNGLRQLSDIPRSLPRLPECDLYNRETGQQKHDNADLLLQPIKRSHLGSDDSQNDSVLRRGSESEQRSSLVEEKSVEVDTVEVKPIVVSRLDALGLNQEVIDQLPELVKYALNKEPPTKEFLDTATLSDLYQEFTIYRDACLKISPMINEYCCSDQAKLKNPDVSKSVDKIDEILHVQRDTLSQARQNLAVAQKVFRKGFKM